MLLHILYSHLIATDVPCLKFVNHRRQILDLEQPKDDWFKNVIRYSMLTGLCFVTYNTINHGMHVTFVERWHLKTSSFHLPLCEMTITLDDVSCLIHLPIRGKLIDQGILNREWANEVMIAYLGAHPTEVANEIVDTKSAHARFKLLEELYKYHLQMVVDV